jgi:hypothetical protein
VLFLCPVSDTTRDYNMCLQKSIYICIHNTLVVLTFGLDSRECIEYLFRCRCVLVTPQLLPVGVSAMFVRWFFRMFVRLFVRVRVVRVLHCAVTAIRHAHPAARAQPHHRNTTPRPNLLCTRYTARLRH